MTKTLQARIAQTYLKQLGLYGGIVDGLWGDKSEEAAAKWENKVDPVPAISSPIVGALDQRSERNISTLHPKAQKAARDFMAAAMPAVAVHGVVIKIICGTRTYAEQDALYAQGRTKPGKVVTKAMGGFSNHNFGIAWDIGLFEGDEYLEESPLYRVCADIGKARGLDCGAFWSFVDEPHYQLKTNVTMAQMRERVARKQDVLDH